MNAAITYRVQSIPHPWPASSSHASMHVYALVKVTTPESGPSRQDPVAIFNLDSEAEVVMGHVLGMREERRRSTP